MTDMDKLVEDVARVIAFNMTALTPKGLKDCRWPKDWSYGEQQAHRKTARATILATLRGVREPTTEMYRALIKARGFDPDEPADTLEKSLLGVGVKQDWQAMIDAVLS